MIARVVAGMSILLRRIAEVQGQRGGAGSALESQCLDGADYAQSVADAGYAHLLEGIVIEFEQDVASDVVFLEGVCVCAAFYVCQPFGDVGVGPGPEDVEEGGLTHGGDKDHCHVECTGSRQTGARPRPRGMP